MNHPLWDDIACQLAQTRRIPVRIRSADPLSGGDTSPAFRVTTSDEAYFVKLGPVQDLDRFSAEAEGLEILGRTGALRCPLPWLYGVAQENAFLVLEYIPLSPRGTEADLGEALAKLHTHVDPRYGWHRNNALGRSLQDNHFEDSWATFWCNRRLGPQLRMARLNGASTRLLDVGERLLGVLPDWLGRHEPPASLLHGDLWRGNCAFDPHGKPVIYDPAVYYGDREADLAMCALFGGFGPDFWTTYTAHWPLPDGYPERRKLYMLYHVLNHYNLFGGSYGAQARTLMEDLLTQAR